MQGVGSIRINHATCPIFPTLIEIYPKGAQENGISPGHQGRILLVDDESAILRTFRYCLEDEGYSVATANSAAQAEALLQRQVFDLCFLDLRLGEDNGLDVLAQMRIQAPGCAW
jgi:ActR/RegA family two-component response regulator